MDVGEEIYLVPLPSIFNSISSFNKQLVGGDPSKRRHCDVRPGAGRALESVEWHVQATGKERWGCWRVRLSNMRLLDARMPGRSWIIGTIHMLE
jgi:hypothetical protein